jgi:hypothetical protein
LASGGDDLGVSLRRRLIEGQNAPDKVSREHFAGGRFEATPLPGRRQQPEP